MHDYLSRAYKLINNIPELILVSIILNLLFFYCQKFFNIGWLSFLIYFIFSIFFYGLNFTIPLVLVSYQDHKRMPIHQILKKILQNSFGLVLFTFLFFLFLGLLLVLLAIIIIILASLVFGHGYLQNMDYILRGGLVLFLLIIEILVALLSFMPILYSLEKISWVSSLKRSISLCLGHLNFLTTVFVANIAIFTIPILIIPGNFVVVQLVYRVACTYISLVIGSVVLLYYQKVIVVNR